jgi:N-acetylmuramoyl-L-alanine amidase
MASQARRLRNSLGTALLALCLSGCAHGPARNPLAQWVPSSNFGPREPVLVVIHGTAQDSVRQSLETLRGSNSGGPVSAHYLIGRDGKLFQLVAESERAWHAGEGSWGTISDVNSASIGIELDNDGYEAFSDAQIQALIGLLDDVCRRRNIPRSQVIGHSDLAPSRKRDPGPQFPWERLAHAGFGLWPVADRGDPPPAFDGYLALKALGYPMQDRDAAVRAFHLHYRGLESDVAMLDAEDLRLLHALTRD